MKTMLSFCVLFCAAATAPCQAQLLHDAPSFSPPTHDMGKITGIKPWPTAPDRPKVEKGNEPVKVTKTGIAAQGEAANAPAKTPAKEQPAAGAPVEAAETSDAAFFKDPSVIEAMESAEFKAVLKHYPMLLIDLPNSKSAPCVPLAFRRMGRDVLVYDMYFKQAEWMRVKSCGDANTAKLEEVRAVAKPMTAEAASAKEPSPGWMAKYDAAEAEEEKQFQSEPAVQCRYIFVQMRSWEQKHPR